MCLRSRVKKQFLDTNKYIYSVTSNTVHGLEEIPLWSERLQTQMEILHLYLWYAVASCGNCIHNFLNYLLESNLMEDSELLPVPQLSDLKGYLILQTLSGKYKFAKYQIYCNCSNRHSS